MKPWDAVGWIVLGVTCLIVAYIAFFVVLMLVGRIRRWFAPWKPYLKHWWQMPVRERWWWRGRRGNEMMVCLTDDGPRVESWIGGGWWAKEMSWEEFNKYRRKNLLYPVRSAQ